MAWRAAWRGENGWRRRGMCQYMAALPRESVMTRIAAESPRRGYRLAAAAIGANVSWQHRNNGGSQWRHAWRVSVLSRLGYQGGCLTVAISAGGVYAWLAAILQHTRLNNGQLWRGGVLSMRRQRHRRNNRRLAAIRQA